MGKKKNGNGKWSIGEQLPGLVSPEANVHGPQPGDPVAEWGEGLDPRTQPVEAILDGRSSFAVRRSLAVKLTPKEISAKADEAMVIQRQIDEIEAKKKATAADFSAFIQDLKAQVRRNVEAHYTGEEQRTVDCTQVFDLVTKKTWFDFQGHRHDERRMTDYEILETNNTLFGDAQIEGALNRSEPEAAPDSPKTTEELARECGERARASAANRERKLAAKGKKGVTIQLHGSSQSDISDVIREESTKKGKVDHVSSEG